MSGYILFLTSLFYFMYYNFMFYENLVCFMQSIFFSNRVLYGKKICSLLKDRVQNLKSVKSSLIWTKYWFQGVKVEKTFFSSFLH